MVQYRCGGKQDHEEQGGSQGAATGEVQVVVRRRAGVRGGISITVPISLSAALPSAAPYFFYRCTHRTLKLCRRQITLYRLQVRQLAAASS